MSLRSLPALSPTAAAFGVCLLFAVLDWLQGYRGLAWEGDNDSMLRLVQIRDLLAGQGWFDLHQYRMGPDGGFTMHWSRLVDAPIAAMIALFGTVTGSQTAGEAVALILWPLLLLGLATYFIARAAHTIGGDGAVLPAALLALTTLAAVGQFDAGSIDHHNLQFVLTIATLAMLLEARDHPIRAVWAGMASGLSIGVGMEAAPYVATAGLIPATWLLLRGREAAPATIWYGLGFAGTAAAIFVGTVAPSAWGAAACDAFSLPHLTAATIGGGGLAAAGMASLAETSAARRAAMLAGVGLVVAGAIALLFPQCLAAPYSDLDPRQKLLWLDNVTETLPFWAVLQQRPSFAAGIYCTPLLALVVCGIATVRRQQTFAYAIAGGFLLAATLTAIWQTRGGIFALGLATIPLAAWLASWRRLAATDAPGAKVKLAFAFLLSMNMTWAAGAEELIKLADPDDSAKLTGNPSMDRACHDAEAYRAIAALPTTTVLSDVNGGAAILLHTRHRALAGPYHRNPGNLIAYDVQSAEPEQARLLLARHEIGLVTVCADGDEAGGISRSKPSSLHARLMRGDVPGWLEIVSGSGPVRAYRVVGGP